MNRVIVFVGPSLDLTSAADVLEAQFAAPVKRGDIVALMAEPDPPTHIGIVDGQFLQQMSISPKEILLAMDKGVRFYGSSSMGALRAVELKPYGMVGVGRIYELYQSGEIDADDEVAITFDPATLAGLCEPLVNVRLATADAIAASVISKAAGEAIIRAGKAIYFPQRTYANILAATRGSLSRGDQDHFVDYLRKNTPDAKRDDALDLLALMRSDISGISR